MNLYDALYEKQLKFNSLIANLNCNKSIVNRFHVVYECNNFEYELEDYITGKRYNHNSSEELIKEIIHDLRKEKIEKLLNI